MTVFLKPMKDLGQVERVLCFHSANNCASTLGSTEMFFKGGIQGQTPQTLQVLAVRKKAHTWHGFNEHGSTEHLMCERTEPLFLDLNLFCM